MMPFNRPPARVLSPSLLGLLVQESASHPAFSIEQLSQAVGTLSRLFTKDRKSLPAEYLDEPLLAAAYRAYFMPVNLGKIQALLDELPDEPGIGYEASTPIAILDLGSGPGTGALACVDWAAGRGIGGIHVISVDRSKMAGQDARRLWDAYCRIAGVASCGLDLYVADLQKSWKGPVWSRIREQGPYDVIMMANCLNELFTSSPNPCAKRAELVAEMFTFLRRHGTVMIIEPALRPVARDLHRVRDELLRRKVCTVYSPCLHDQACPALIREDDWCHEERPWNPPASIQAIDREVGFIKDALKFSYLVLRKDGRTVVPRQPDVYRVVSELMEFKGEKRAWLCNETGRSEVGRQDRLATPQNAAVDAWHRGAIVQIEQIVRKEREGKVSAVGRIESSAGVEIIRPV